MADKTFIVHRDWLTAIEGLPIEQQDAIIGDLIRYGTELELQHGDDPIITAMVNLVKGKIDFSKSKYEQKVQMGKNAGRKIQYSDKMIYDAAQKGMTAAQIAKELGCSNSKVNHSEGWRLRDKEVSFNEEGRII